MPAIVEFPTVVTEALEQFADLFPNEPARRHFAEYLTGLIVAERKNVSAINRQFAQTTHPSCLNRWLNEGDWDVEQLNLRRLAWLQQDPSMRYSERGVIALDNVLIDHDGKRIEDVGYFWDHAEQRYKIAHDYLIADDVCPNGKHYPLHFRRFVKREHCQLKHQPFVDHNQLFRDLVDWTIGRQIPGNFTFDSWFTNAANLNHIHFRGRGYVGDLKFNRKIIFKGQEVHAQVLAAMIVPADRKLIELNGDKQWYFTQSIRIDGVNHPLRIVVLWKNRDDQTACKILVTNRTQWDIHRILRTYRQRWQGTECFHRDGKQHPRKLGMNDCPFRKGRGQTSGGRHMFLVFLAYSVLMRQLRCGRARAWALERLTTIGQACRAVLRQTLGQTIDWVIAHVTEDQWNVREIKRHLTLE